MGRADMGRCRIPSVLILCLWARVVGADVLPPANVTLLCHNMQNTLQWTYEPPSDGIKFNVTVSSMQMRPVSLLVDSPATSIDLSEFSDPGDEYMVQVSAVKGPEESEPVPEDGIDFSYFKDATATIICAVDFPLINVTREDKLILLSFTHPGLLYPTDGKTKKKKSLDSQTDLPDFEYHIEFIDESQSYTYTCSEPVCRNKLPVPDNENRYCLNISGEMNNIQVQTPNTYCAEPQETPGISPLAYMLPIALVGAVVGLVGLMLFIKKTRPKTSGPEALAFPKGPQQTEPVSPESTVYSTVDDKEPSSPDPLLPPNQDSSQVPLIPNDTANGSSPRNDMRLRTGVEVNENEAAYERAAGAQGPLDEGYTEGKYLEEGEQAYEPRNMTAVNSG